jgi:hypothetical protein
VRGCVVPYRWKNGKKTTFNAVYTAGGKQRWKSFDTRKDAERFLTETVREVQRGTWKEPKPIAFQEYCDRWLAGLAGSLKPSTIATYTSTLIRLKTYSMIARWRRLPWRTSIGSSPSMPPS